MDAPLRVQPEPAGQRVELLPVEGWVDHGVIVPHLADVGVGEEVRRIRKEADLRFGFRVLEYRCAVAEDCAVVRTDDAADHAEQGALSRAV